MLAQTFCAENMKKLWHISNSKQVCQKHSQWKTTTSQPLSSRPARTEQIQPVFSHVKLLSQPKNLYSQNKCIISKSIERSQIELKV